MFIIFAAFILAAPQLHAQFYDNAKGSPLVALLESAQKSIKIEIYEMNDEKVLTALSEALDRGVEVSIVQEPNPLQSPCQIFTQISTHDNPVCKNQKKLVAAVKNHGGKYEAFNKVELCGIEGKSCFQHGKIALIDDHTAVISTGNFNDSNLCDLDQSPDVCNRDYSFVTNDQEILSGLNSFFEQDLLGKRYDPLSLMTSTLKSKLTVSSISLDNILEFIASAKKSIQIQNQYLEEPALNEALIKAAKRGVQVEAMVSDVCNFQKPSPGKHAQITETFTGFDKAGISSRLFNKKHLINGKPGYLHAKAIVVDGQYAWVGSMNGSTESATMNREYGIYFEQPRWVSQLSKIMKADYEDPTAQTWEQSLRCQS
ncbi:MAG: phospholipase D-like domain-containing protein [Myxococcaceae bacterium]